MKDFLTLQVDMGSIVKINGRAKRLGCNLIVNVPIDFLEADHDILDLPDRLDKRKGEPA